MLSAGLGGELRAVRAELGSTSGDRALHLASAAVALLAWTRRALGRAHLVAVAAALHDELGLGLAGLRALRLPIDLLEAFPHWRRGSNAGFAPRALGLALMPAAAARPLGAIRLQVSTAWGGTGITLGLLRQLRQRLDRSVRLVVLVDPESDAAQLRRLAGASLGRRRGVRFVRLAFGTIYARDNAVAARDGAGRRTLLVPRALRTAEASDTSPLDARAARRRLGMRVIRSRLYWHGGNMLFDGNGLVVGADTIAENVSRLGLTEAEVRALLRAELGHEASVLGETAGRFDHERNRIVASGQASYHVDLDVALLGRTGREQRPTALVADPHLGLSHLAAVLGRRGVTWLPDLSSPALRRQLAHEYRLSAAERTPKLAAYRQRLEGLGYRVIGVPELRTRDDRDTVLNLDNVNVVYCNVLPGLNRGRPAAHYVAWGIPALDAVAERAIAAAGVVPVPVARSPQLANAMMRRAAGLRCFCGAMP